MDEIRIKGLKIFAHHGVLPEENEKGQYFFVDAVLETDLRKAGISDDLLKTVNYADVCMLIKKEMTENTYSLIEAAVEHIALRILKSCSGIKSARIELKKPYAPVEAEFESISVRIKRTRHRAFIAWGSSEDLTEDGKTIPKAELIKKALKLMDEDPFIEIIKNSSVYESRPYGGVAENDFLNGVSMIETFYEPEELLEALHGIEAVCGRVRKEHWGDRSMDLDIIFFDDLVYASADLVIPHADMANRDFVLKPLCEIAEDLYHPVLKKSVSELYKSLA